MNKIPTLLFLFLSVNVFGQVGFKRNINIPVDKNGALELPWAGGLNFPVFSEIDLNGDNVPDLFAFDRSNNRCVTFINNGSGNMHCWVYAPQYADRFPDMKGWAYLCDYDCDNKPDLYTTNFLNNGISLYKNVSQGSTLTFTLVDSTLSYGASSFNVFASAFLIPNIDDIDGDGDMDVLGNQSQCLGTFAFYRNMSVEHYGVCDSLNDYTYVTNSWGNFALRSGLYDNAVVGSWNISCFAGPGGSLYRAERDDTYASIRTIDIDGDGDKDALIGDSQTKNSLLVINGGTASNANMVLPQDTLFPSYDTSVNLHWFTTTSYLDLDDDGLKDLVVSQSEFENNKGILLYKNLGTNAIPNFHYQVDDFLQNEMIDVGESATPVLFDYNSDGLNDLVIGNRYFTTGDTSHVTGLTLYKNTGTSSSPAFQFITDDYLGLHSIALGGQIYPAFGDLDSDGDVDMILGLDDGELGYFENTAGPGNPAVFATPVFNYMSIHVNQAVTPQLFDIDQDGLLDLVMGCKIGSVKYFKNVGSANFAFYSTVPSETNLGNIDVRTPSSTDGYSVPFLFKQNGDIRMFVSCMRGLVFLYGNIANNLNGTFTLLDTVITNSAGSRYAHNLTVSGGDINNDSLVDMILGFYGGGLQFYYQDTSTTSIASIRTEDPIRIYPVPASESVVIKNSLPAGKVEYRLFDLTGRMILSKTEISNYSILDVSNFSEGVYVLNISSASFSGTRKIIIERN